MNMKKLLFFISILFLGFTSYAQKADTLHMKTGFWKITYTKGTNPITLNQAIEEMKINESAYTQMKSAKNDLVLSQIIGGVGGFLIGWPLGAAVAGGDPNWTMAAVGAGLVVVSIPISKSFNKKAKSAIREYNQGLLSSANQRKPQYNFVLSGNGIGLKMSF